MHDITERLESWFTDWDGSCMVPGEPPRDGIHCDVLMDAKAEIERLRAERDWRPIETAPKDDSEFLAWDSGARKMDVCTMQRAGGPYEWQCWAVQVDGEYGPDPDDFGYANKNITHWMPLPTPPKDK
jgi:hypothetical protein